MDSTNSIFARLKEEFRSLGRDAITTAFTLFRIMIPIMILVKILKELDLIKYLAVPLEPVMQLVGLPAETGLVWATAMIASIYNGFIVYFTLLPDMPTLSVAQVTVLGLLMLVAHSLPLELKIAQQAGGKLVQQCVIRVAGALIFGIAAHLTFEFTGILQEPAVMLFEPTPQEGGLLMWALGELKNLATVFCICTMLLALMRLLKVFRITDILGYVLRPLLRFMGMGKEAAAITVFGLTMGITYGSGLIISEVRAGRLSKGDIFAANSFMSLTHAVIEDTMLMALIGASTIGTFWMRLGFSLLAVALLTRIFSRQTVPATASI